MSYTVVRSAVNNYAVTDDDDPTCMEIQAALLRFMERVDCGGFSWEQLNARWQSHVLAPLLTDIFRSLPVDAVETILGRGISDVELETMILLVDRAVAALDATPRQRFHVPATVVNRDPVPDSSGDTDYDPDAEEKAKALFLEGMRCIDIANVVHRPAGTVYAWSSRGRWRVERNKLKRAGASAIVAAPVIHEPTPDPTTEHPEIVVEAIAEEPASDPTLPEIAADLVEALALEPISVRRAPAALRATEVRVPVVIQERIENVESREARESIADLHQTWMQ